MARIEIYSTQTCYYCMVAKALLLHRGIEFTEIDVAGKPELRAAMAERAGGRRSLPQIFIDGRHIGGCDDLQALDRAGRLATLVA